MAGPSGTLEELLDERAVCALLKRYARALDQKDWELLATCFVPDAVALYGEAIGRVEGVDAIAAACRAALEKLDSSHHVLSNEEIEVDGDSGKVRSYVHAQHTKAGTPGGDNFTIGGIYVDAIVRTPDGWRIRERELKMLWQEGNPAVLG
jgi:uncharacterized protein (TIGR02246 family)